MTRHGRVEHGFMDDDNYNRAKEKEQNAEPCRAKAKAIAVICQASKNDDEYKYNRTCPVANVSERSCHYVWMRRERQQQEKSKDSHFFIIKANHTFLYSPISLTVLFHVKNL